MNTYGRNILLALGVAGLGYFLWSLFVASRYQALCEISYWSATEAQLRACDEIRASLPRN
ncbi:hypothetical protein IY145_12525 [Methylosinus sp. H3A]|uniref:hypothetical protein n=1 Tax=Methylosinus sp. H3A TaxID=2785786 RepID=UPI0018C2DF77|nr:hypothetical protein [Methylosinus sp. H3A]MBG0810203.1 hypothetical protein [Methylosinus sp. H3A]